MQTRKNRLNTFYLCGISFAAENLSDDNSSSNTRKHNMFQFLFELDARVWVKTNLCTQPKMQTNKILLALLFDFVQQSNKSNPKKRSSKIIFGTSIYNMKATESFSFFIRKHKSNNTQTHFKLFRRLSRWLSRWCASNGDMFYAFHDYCCSIAWWELNTIHDFSVVAVFANRNKHEMAEIIANVLLRTRYHRLKSINVGFLFILHLLLRIPLHRWLE